MKWLNFLLPLPVKFDANEWFVLGSICLFLIAFFKLPRRFPPAVTVLILLFNGVLAKTTDFTLAASYPFDFYNYSDTPKLDLFDQLLQYVLIPLAGYLTLYTYDYWNKKGLNPILFVPLAIILSVGYEYLSIKCHVFTYKGWNLFYSAIAYMILIPMNMYFFHLAKKWVFASIIVTNSSPMAKNSKCPIVEK